MRVDTVSFIYEFVDRRFTEVEKSIDQIKKIDEEEDKASGKD